MDYQPTTYIRNLQTFTNTRPGRDFHRSRFEKFESFYYQDLFSHYGCVNAIEFSSRDGNLLASGGDDKRVLLWNVTEAMLKPKYKPIKMTAGHHSNIFCLAFNKNDDRLFSSGNDGQVIIHDLNSLQLIDIFMCDNSVYGLSVNPDNDNLVATACEDGTVHVIDTRLQKSDGICMVRSTSAFHSVMFSPVNHQLIATAHSRDGVALWDIRSPKKEVLHYGCRDSKERGMYARFNQSGTQLICLRRRLPLALYNLNETDCIAEFTCEGYSNSCTMKSCCFVGDKDQYIISGSDDFGIYVWKLPDTTVAGYQKFIDKSSKILKGHRSIVNQVRFNPSANMIVSSGVEKVIKLWSTEPMPLGEGNYKLDDSKPRERYSHNQYLQLILDSGDDDLLQNFESENTQEDSTMLAFFDSLIQHEADGSESDSSESDEESPSSPHPRHDIEELEDSESSDGNMKSEAPASLESLGITRTSEEETVNSEVIKKLRSLRAQIKEDGHNWSNREIRGYTASDFLVDKDVKEKASKSNVQLDVTDKLKTSKGDKTGGPCTSNTKRRHDSGPQLAKRKIQRNNDPTQSRSVCNSDSEDDENATRTRQRNARRCSQKTFKFRRRSTEASTSGLQTVRTEISRGNDVKTSFLTKLNPRTGKTNDLEKMDHNENHRNTNRKDLD